MARTSAWRSRGGRLVYPLMAAIVAALGLTAWHVGRSSEQVVLDSARFTARGLLEAVRTVRSVYASEVVGRIDPEVTPATPEYRHEAGAIPVPATFSLAFGEALREKEEGIELRLFSDHPWPYRSDGGLRDDFERDALAYLRERPDGAFEAIEEREGRRWHRYAIADRMTAACVECHNTHPLSPARGWEVGDVRGVLSVARPLDEVETATAQAMAAKNWWLAGTGGLVVVGLAILLRRWQQELRERQVAMAEAEHARRRAEQASRSKTEFLANMSHEIRTPMTAILGFADVLDDPRIEADDRGDAVRTIRRNGEHLLSIINDILDISKLESGRMQAEPTAVSPACLVGDVVDLMRVRAEARGIELRADGAGTLPVTVRVDATRLRQILVNLVGNAIKFTEQGSVVVATDFDAASSRLRFAVRDSGVGIPREQLEAIFDAFRQADDSTTRRFGGTGLGLTISRRLARMLGGDITVESEPGHGSTFTLQLPVEAVATPVAAPPAGGPGSPRRPAAGAEPEPTPLAGMRILLAEDGRDNQRLLTWILRRAGAEVHVVENGRRAVETVLEAREAGCPFDLVLMDMQMPVLDGYAATRTLRERGHEGPVVALTAHAMAGDRERCLAAGCDDYLTKPVDRGELVGRAAEWSGRAAA